MIFSIVFVLVFIVGFAFGLAMPFIMVKFPFYKGKEVDKEEPLSATEILNEYLNGKQGE